MGEEMISSNITLPRLTIDRLSLVFDVPGSRQEWIHRICSDPADCAELIGCELEVSKGAGGYGRAALLRREGETIRLDYDPWRTIVRRTPVTAETWRGRISDLIPAGKLTFVDKETGEVLERWDPERPERLVQVGGDEDPFSEMIVDQERLPWARLEGNPSKFPGFDAFVAHIGETACRLTGRSPAVSELMRPTRVDVAVDYPTPMEHFGVTANRKRLNKQIRGGEQGADTDTAWRKKGRLETLYLGCAGGNGYRIYDKVREVMHDLKLGANDLDKVAAAMREMGFTPDWEGRPVTRVEATVRDIRVNGKSKARTTKELRVMNDPFTALEVGENNLLTDPSDWKETAFAYMVQAIGLDAALKVMPPNTRTRWRKKLGLVALRKGVPRGESRTVNSFDAGPVVHPSAVFEADYTEVIARAIPSLLQ